MKNKRSKVFETNSSSSHSICIESGEYVADILFVDKEGICRIYPGEFGWEVEDYNDSATKASYCLTYVKNNSPDSEETLKDVIMEVTGATSVEFIKIENGYKEWGYIDHQSNCICGEAFESKQNLKDFIFNKKSTLHTDNDNH